MTLGQWLKKKRLKAGLSQCDAGILLGLHAQNISNWENNKARPPIMKYRHLAKAYGINEMDLQIKCLEQTLIDTENRFGRKIKDA